jgi:hypothetical protein
MASPSAGASTAHGYDATNDKLRSVLAHPLGLPLVCFLNEKSISQEFQLYSDLDHQDKLIQTETIFSEAAQKWNGQKEVDFTTKLLTKIKESQVVAGLGRELRDVGGDDWRGIADLLLGSNPSTTPRSVVTAVKVGVGNSQWWNKVGQGVTYLELVGGAQQGEHCFRKPMILSVITLDKVEESGSIGQLKARFGAFLCTFKDSKDCNSFHVSLLWQEETHSLEAASQAFGKLILATFKCEKWRDMNPTLKYRYLGPNCCRVGEMVTLALVPEVLCQRFFT